MNKITARTITEQEFDRLNEKYYDGKYDCHIRIKDYKRRQGYYEAEGFYGAEPVITIAERMVEEGGDPFVLIVKHEFAHHIAFLKIGQVRHGSFWKTEMRKMGVKNPRRKANKSVVHESGYKYVLECEECSNTWGRYRKSKLVKHPEWWYCKCGGRLKRVK